MKMKFMVPEITPNSSLHDLTLSLLYSFQETEQKLVEDILTTRENVLNDQIKKYKHIVDQMLKEKGGFAARVNEEKMKEKCDVLEQEGELKRRILEEEVKRLREQCEYLMDIKVGFEEKMKEKCGVEKEGELKRRILEEEVESLRKKCEELKKGSGLMENMLSSQKREMEDERRLQGEMFENRKDLLQKEFKKELDKMRECHSEEMERNRDTMKKKLSLCVFEKFMVEKEVESLKEKCEELERNYDIMKKKVSLGVSEKWQLEKELKKSLMRNEEAGKELEGELEKARKNYEEQLKRERDLGETNLILAKLEKLDLEEELKKSRKDFEERIQVLEVKNLGLHKKVEQHIDSFWKMRSLAELIKGASDSAISRNVRANELLSNGSDAGQKASNVDGHLIKYPVSSGEPLPITPLQTEFKCLRSKHTGIHLGEKSRCLFLENELEDGEHNKNNCRLKCKRKRSINESEDDSIGLCSANSRVESHVISSNNKEVAGCQIGKEITWRQSADMLLALRNDPELCMASVSALYRRHISAGSPSNKGILSGIDIVSTTAIAKYLVNDDPANKLSRSVLEVQQDCPYVLQTCWKLANQYKEQIFEIYQKELDPLFCPKS